jgi:hypothetical protein
MQTQTAMIITGQTMFYWEPIVFVLYHCWLCKNPIVEAGIQVTSKDGTKQQQKLHQLILLHSQNYQISLLSNLSLWQLSQDGACMKV